MEEFFCPNEICPNKVAMNLRTLDHMARNIIFVVVQALELTCLYLPAPGEVLIFPNWNANSSENPKNLNLVLAEDTPFAIPDTKVVLGSNKTKHKEEK